MAAQAEGPLSRRATGREGEDIALAFFLARGFALVCRNWHCRYGELDIVLAKDGAWHAVEVKARRNARFGLPEAAVTAVKLARLRDAIEALRDARPDAPEEIRLHVLAVTLVPGRVPEILFLEDIGAQ
jgi:putative endonuclease